MYTGFMISVTWLGQACVVVSQQAKDSKELVRLVMDPYSKEVGFTLPKVEAAVVTISHNHSDHNNVAGVAGKPFVIREAGEYEVAGFSIEAIPSFHDAAQGKERGANLIVRAQTPEVSFVHFGDFGQDELTLEQIEAIGDVDVAFIPVGGTFTVDGAGAAKIISQLEPKVVVPIHYKIEGIAIDALAGPEHFFSALGQKPLALEGEWKIKATDLPSEGTRVVQLQASK